MSVFSFDPVIPLQLAAKQTRPTTKFHVPLQLYVDYVLVVDARINDPLSSIMENEPGETIPLVLRKTTEYIKNYGKALSFARRNHTLLDSARSKWTGHLSTCCSRLSNQTSSREIQWRWEDLGRSEHFTLFHSGQPVVYEQYGDIHLAACVLKTFLRDLSEPLMTFRLYPELLGLSGSEYVLVIFSSICVVTSKH